MALFSQDWLGMNLQPTFTSAAQSHSALATNVSLSWILPAYNEEENFANVVRRIITALESQVSDFELIIVDDGSTDRTGEIADQMAEADDRVRVIHNPENVNYGVSLIRGIRAARCAWILHNGADLPLAPEDLDKFISRFSDSDIIVACRLSRAAHSPWRKLTSITNRLLLQVLFSPNVSDLNFVQFYRTAYVRQISLLSTSPAFVTPELILRAEHTGRRVRQVKAEFRHRHYGRAHFGKLRDILWTFKDMLRFRIHTLLKGWD